MAANTNGLRAGHDFAWSMGKTVSPHGGVIETWSLESVCAIASTDVDVTFDDLIPAGSIVDAVAVTFFQDVCTGTAANVTLKLSDNSTESQKPSSLGTTLLCLSRPCTKAGDLVLSFVEVDDDPGQAAVNTAVHVAVYLRVFHAPKEAYSSSLTGSNQELT